MCRITSVYCLAKGNFTTTKAAYFGFFLPVFNLALGLFREEQCSVANFDEPRQKRGSHQICPMPIFFGKKMFFHVIITSTLLFYPLRFAYVLEKFLNFLAFLKIFSFICCFIK